MIYKNVIKDNGEGKNNIDGLAPIVTNPKIHSTVGTCTDKCSNT